MPSIDDLDRSIARSLAHSSLHTVLYLLIHSHIHPPTYRIIHTFIHMYIPNHLRCQLLTNTQWHRSLMHSQCCIFPNPLTHSFSHVLGYSHIHSLIRSIPISHIHSPSTLLPAHWPVLHVIRKHICHYNPKRTAVSLCPSNWYEFIEAFMVHMHM